MDVFYCQRTIFPIASAHAIHTVLTAAAFAEAGANTHYFPACSFGDKGKSVLRFLQTLGYANAPQSLHLHSAPTRHKGLYHLVFAFLLRRTMSESQKAGRESVCFASSVKEAVIALDLRACTAHPERTKVVFEIHHLISRLKSGKAAEKLYTLEKRAFEECDLVVFNCAALARQAESYLPAPSRSIVSPLGLNERLIHPLPAPTHEYPDKILLAYFGSLLPGKGVENVIRALALLPKRYHLRIIGGQPPERLEKLQMLAERLGLYSPPSSGAGNNSRVEFFGQVEQRAMAPLLACADMAIIPLETEKDFLAPMKMYEAVGYALPIVATPMPSLEDALTGNKNALFSKNTTPESLAKTINKLGNDENLRYILRSNNISLAVELSIKKRIQRLLNEFNTLW